MPICEPGVQKPLSCLARENRLEPYYHIAEFASFFIVG